MDLLRVRSIRAGRTFTLPYDPRFITKRFLNQCRERIAVVAHFIKKGVYVRILGDEHGCQFSGGRGIAEATEDLAFAPSLVSKKYHRARSCSQAPINDLLGCGHGYPRFLH